MARLWIAIDGKKKVWKIPAAGVTVGGDNSQLKLIDPAVEGLHIQVKPAGDDWVVTLMADAGMLLVNDESTTEAILSNGDVITIGDTEIHYEDDGAQAAPAAARPAAGARRPAGGGARRGGGGGGGAGGGRGGGGRGGGGGRRPSSRREMEPAGGSGIRGEGRLGRYRKQQSMPGWVTGLIVIAGLGLLAVVVFSVLGGLGTEGKIFLEGALEAAKIGKFDVAYERLAKAKPLVTPKLYQECKDKIDELKRIADDNLSTQRMKSAFFSRIVKYEDSKVVRAHTPINVFQLLVRIDMFRKEFPDHPKEIGDKLNQLEKTYTGIIDMDNPEEGWMVTAVHDPYYKSQHHKKFYLSFKVLEHFRNRYGSRHSALCDKLDAQTKKFAKMFAERELKDTEKLINSKETFLPTINAQINNLKLMIEYVSLSEWENQGKVALKALLAYRESL